MTKQWVAIQRNPSSGSGPRRALLFDLIAGLRQHGLQPRLFSRRERLQAYLAESERRERLLGIVAAGGDGTVGDVLNRYPGIPVAILPLGTENLLAKFLGIKRSGQFVADMLAAGQLHRFDLGTVGNRRFSLMASCGFDADILQRTHAQRTGHITKMSYLQPIYDSLRKYEYPELRLFLDGAVEPIAGRLAFVANLPAYALGLPIAKSARGDDGLLDVRLFQGDSAFQMIRYFYMVTSGQHEQLPDVISVQAKQVRIESDRPVPAQIDGDPAGTTPLDIGIEPEACQLFVPEGYDPPLAI